MRAPKLRSIVAAALVFAGAMSVAAAQVRTANTHPHTVPGVVSTSHATPSPSPTPLPFVNNRAFASVLAHVMPGQRIPLSMLPPLPPKTKNNTAHPGRRLVRPMAADGSTETITTNACNNVTGTFYVIGCAFTWKSSGLPSATDNYTDYYIAPNSSTATAASGSYKSGANPANGNPGTFTLNGTYVLATYDTTLGKWETVIYATVGGGYTLQVFQDAQHTEEIYQFSALNSPDAYIYATGLTAGDAFIVYVEYTSQNPYCVFSAPAQGSYPTTGTGALCNPASLAGVVSSNGTLSVTWPLSSSLPAGTYSVGVYDKTASVRLGEVQVSMTGSSNLALQLTAEGGNPSPAPLPVATPATAFAWDDSGDQSTKGFIASTIATFPSGTYTWGVHSPDGRVVTTAASTGSGSTLTTTIPFASGAFLSPGNYASKIYTTTLYDKSNASMVASQFFELLGYNALTQFDVSGTLIASLSIAVGGNTTATGLRFTNNSDVQFGTGNGDNLAAVAFTTGKDFTHTAGNGVGIMAALNGFTIAQCGAAGGCTSTATDHDGNVWNVNDQCSGVAVSATGECEIIATPQSATVTLAPSEYLEIPTITFYSAAAGTCGNVCDGSTEMLPQHGLSYSVISEESAWNPVYFTNASSTYAGTAAITITGQCTGATPACNNNTGVEAHYYTLRFNQSAYQRNTPYSLSESYWDQFKVVIKNNSSSAITELAVGMPGPFGAVNTLQTISVDAQSTGAWNNWVTCPAEANLNPSVFLCSTARGGGIASGATGTFYFDENPTVASFSYIDAVIESVNNPANVNFQLTPTTTNDAVYAIQPATNVDSLALGLYSLNSTLMSATFNPSAVGQNEAPALSLVYQNTPAGSDPFPDYVDAVVIDFPSTYSLSAISASGAPGWAEEGASWASGGNTYYLFGLCAAQNNGGTATPPPTTPLTSAAVAVPTCAAATEQADSLAPGASVSMNFTLSNIGGATSIPFTVWAHGANAGGWSAPIAATLTATAESASAGISKINGTAVTANSEPSVTQDSNVYQYTIKNTSAATALTQETIAIPATDVSGLTAAQLGATAWVISAESMVSGCASPTITTTQVSGSTNGSIVITGCSLAAGASMVVQFTGVNPSVQNDEWQFPTVILPGSVTAGETWLSDTKVKVLDTIGISIVVDPSAPGPGGSNPVLSCGGCSFSGSTVDFGNPPANATTGYGDIVRASVYADSSAHSTWLLCLDTNNNPASTLPIAKELQSEGDSAHSTSAAGFTVDQTTYANVPVIGSGNTQMELANGPFSIARSTPFDIIQSFQLSIGTEHPPSSVANLTYTLIEDTASCPAS